MARKLLIRTNQFAYHIYNRSNNKDWFQIPLNQVWDICRESLLMASDKFNFQLHAFVLMGNHYHMLATFPDSNIDKVMYEFGRNFSMKLRNRSGRINRMFGDRYKWSIVQQQSYLSNVVKYVYQNPLRAGLCARCEDYNYSTYSKFGKESFADMKIQPLLEEGEEFKDWINNQMNSDQLDCMRRGMKRSEFKLRSKGDMKLPNF
ncbi:MAG: hypothetical protein COW00_09375 [Bdellovibrio sp. CG12_big_fil_rev_8_21_14_0_65_39_13]|nr:MAG: hypothetical protein COW00_09375 [Bdellovibrio sp. CG12_big_fil_rev_8_21_14_0_65_39_13]